MSVTDAGGRARAARVTATGGGAIGDVERSLRRDTESPPNKTRKRHRTDGIPNYPPWRVRDPLGNGTPGEMGTGEPGEG